MTITSARAPAAPEVRFRPLRPAPPRVDTARRLAALTALAALAAAAALVLARTTGLWLDEAQSVAIARLPLTGLLQALKHDGSPPLYYLLLHAWIALFGTGDTAVRSLSAVFAVGAVPAIAIGGRRAVGARAGWVAGAVAASAPFLYRYGTEARMYSLVVLLAAWGWLALERAWRAPRWANLAGVAAAAGLLALTHYWALFLVIPLAGLAVYKRRWDVLGALAVGGLLFVPWLPDFAFQLAHTGAPWGAPANTGIYEFALRGFAAGPGRLGLLGLLYLGMVLLAVFGVRRGDDVVVDLRGSSFGLRVAAAVVVPLTIGLAVSAATGSAFAVRYAAIVFVPFAFLMATGVELIRPAGAARVVVAGMVALGLFHAVVDVHTQRSQAPQVAAVLNAQAKPGDEIVFCPDQLAPGVTRLLHTEATTSAYPTNTPGTIIDWYDYAARNKAADPVGYADMVARAPGTVWLLTQTGYRTFGSQCARLYDEVKRVRPGGHKVVSAKRKSYEHGALWRFPATQKGAS